MHENLFNLIAKYGFLVIVKYQEQNIAAGIFLYGEELLHYHLSAFDLNIKKNGTFNLMIYEAAMHGKEIGLKMLHRSTLNLIMDNLEQDTNGQTPNND